MTTKFGKKTWLKENGRFLNAAEMEKAVTKNHKEIQRAAEKRSAGVLEVIRSIDNSNIKAKVAMYYVNHPEVDVDQILQIWEELVIYEAKKMLEKWKLKAKLDIIVDDLGFLSIPPRS